MSSYVIGLGGQSACGSSSLAACMTSSASGTAGGGRSAACARNTRTHSPRGGSAPAPRSPHSPAPPQLPLVLECSNCRGEKISIHIIMWKDKHKRHSLRQLYESQNYPRLASPLRNPRRSVSKKKIIQPTLIYKQC